ncbi:MAG: hypothetical protein LHW56_01590 [Candidatus Cloacimonetes bacterium]|nr:hypothetical protein [Candidatus Cloacimonadota bacterium]MDY0171580.1 hypothetical protein [Candidatus Cloacimonadaceae bacterium]
MAYIRPIVMVYQEYASQSISTQQATLYPCVIGPCYQVINPVDDQELAYAGVYSVAEGFSAVPLPSRIAGAEVVASSVQVLLKDLSFVVAAGAIAEPVANTFVLPDGVLPADVSVGDYVAVTFGTDTPVQVDSGLRVISIDPDTKEITVNRSILLGGNTEVGFQVEITRQVESYSLPAGSAALTVDAENNTVSLVAVTYLEYTVDTASVYVGYKALRTDLTTVGTVESATEAASVLGTLTSDNPLGLGVLLTLANTDTPVKFLGVTEDSLAGYTAAKDTLELVDNVYGLVPLTQNPAILNIFKAHCEAMSQPEVGLWRRCFVSTQLMTDKVLSEGTTGAVETKSGEGRLLFRDVSGSFMSDLVSAADQLELLNPDGSVAFSVLVEEVIGDDLLEVTSVFPDAEAEALTSWAGAYQIKTFLDKTQQAAELRLVSQSFGSQRVCHIWPDTAVVEGEQVPGYYLGCAVAGMVAGLPSHQGLTRISVAGIEGLYNANDYFTQSQLDTIADGGTFIFLQQNTSSPPYIRHQLTTDMSTLELRELSFCKNFDYVCVLLKEVLDQFLGKYNIVPSTLALLQTAAEAVLESLRLNNLPKIGSPVLNYKVDSVAQLEAIRDRVEMYVSVNFPYVLNTIGLHVVSQ